MHAAFLDWQLDKIKMWQGVSGDGDLPKKGLLILILFFPTGAASGMYFTNVFAVNMKILSSLSLSFRI